MEVRNLPIKIFSTRGREDIRATEGGGGGDLPRWVLGGAALSAKAERLRVQVDALPDGVRLADDLVVPTIARVTVQEKAMAKSHRPAIGMLFSPSGRGSESLIGLEGDLDVLVSLDGRDAIARASARFESAEEHQVGISAVEEIRAFEPYVAPSGDESAHLKVKLHRYGRPAMDERVAQAFETRLAEAEIPFERRRYAFDLTVYKVAPAGRAVVESFGALHSVRPMPTLSARLDEITTTDIQVVRKEPVDGATYATVGVLDSGIEPTDHLRPWLDTRSFSPYPDEDLDRGHGTATASVLLYGDELSEQAWIGAGGFRMLDAAVFHKDLRGMDEDELVDNIQRAIEAFPDVKIWTFSGGWDVECSDHDFSDFAKALDDIQKRLDVVIFTSAGNCSNFLRRLPAGRITASADSLMAVTVGSAAHERPHGGHAEVGSRSPFSRVGPGPNRIVKPEVVHYGGNAAMSALGIAEPAGVPVLSVTGGVIRRSGTSFSTPRVAALAAGLAQTLDDEAPSPLLLRALILHSARYSDEVRLSDAARVAELGYGVPRSVEDVLFNAQSESTLVLQDRIEKGDYIELFDFPFPPDLLTADGFYRGEILVTLVSSPRLDSRQGAEYCQSDVSVKLGTYDRVKERDTTKRTIINPYGRDGAANLLRPALYTTMASRRQSAFTAERVLRDNHGKYHPVKKYGVSLEEMTEGNRVRHLLAPKRWYLELRGLWAAAAEAAADTAGEVLYQDFCLIVTIRDPSGRANVYDSVARQLAALNFPHADVRVRTGVRVRVV